MTIPIAKDWYATERLSDDVTLIWEPHVDAGIRCNMWHVRGRDRDLLVDSGLGMVPLRESIALLAERPVWCLGTHSHFDHVGAHHEFDERIMHGSEVEIMTSPTRENMVIDQYVTADIFTAYPYDGFDVETYTVKAAPPTRLVDDGDVIDLGDRVFDVLYLPGHSLGELGLFERKSGIFFSGDCIYDGPLVDDGTDSNSDDYVESMERVKELPVTVCHGGHYPSVGRDRMIDIADEYIAGRRTAGCPAAD